MSKHLEYVVSVYEGSNGDITRALYERLTSLGPAGVIATNLFRAQKTSSRAKVYRRRAHKGRSYETKQWSMVNLANALSEHADQLGITWGWQDDPEQEFHAIVLYVDLPTGQVSFHTDTRGVGPDYPGKWDGIRNVAADRVCRWCARLLNRDADTPAASTGDQETPMSHEHHVKRLHDGMTHVGGHPHAEAKKTALFTLIHGEVSDSAHEMRALGVTDAQLAPLLDRQRAWEKIKDHAIATDLS